MSVIFGLEVNMMNGLEKGVGEKSSTATASLGEAEDAPEAILGDWPKAQVLYG